ADDGGGDAGPAVASAVTTRFPMHVENPGTDKPALVGDDYGIYWTDGRTVFWLPLGAPPRDDAGAGAVPLSGTPDPLKHTYALALSPTYVYWAAFDGAGVWSLHRVAKRPL
ncbi:MAG TPA: hypothetical protein PK141_22055, partial [Polyangiaceae bacterium]|nr:hypothetical protein [Polyangiaceae bacterium]